jgi:hypothetical protein
VYWTANCGKTTLVLSCAGTGCGMHPTQVTPTGLTSQLIISGGTLYWQYSNHGVNTFLSCQPGNCSAPSSLGSSVLGGIAAGGSNLFWWSSTTQIDMCNASSCSPIQYVAANSTTEAPYSIASNGSDIFWVDATTGSVRVCGVNGTCTYPQDIITGRTSPTLLTADSNNVYWSEATGVLQCPTIGCAGTQLTLAAGQQNVNSIVSDGSHVYWTNGNNVVRAQIGVANSAVTIAPNEGGAGPVVVTSNAVYWGVSSGDIMLLAK